jgi:hypothetical protein
MSRYDTFWDFGNLGGCGHNETTHVQGVTGRVVTKSLLPFSVSVGGRTAGSLIDALPVVDWEGGRANTGPRSPRLPLAKGGMCAESPKL